MSDQQILQLLRSGKRSKAFANLYKVYPSVLRLIKANSGSKGDAEDIFQEALIVFYRKAQDTNFYLTASIKTYLYSVCFYLWKEELRRRKKNIDLQYKLKKDLEHESSLQEAIEREQLYKRAEQALVRLGKKCKDLLTLFYYHKESMKAIAERLGFRSDKVAKAQKYKCLEKARQLVIVNKQNNG
jgi:RNA polymerase sigma factor (sigma-70 family)